MGRIAPLFIGLLYVFNVGMASAGYKSCSYHGPSHGGGGSADITLHEVDGGHGTEHGSHHEHGSSQEETSDDHSQACDGKCGACALTLSHAPEITSSHLGVLTLDVRHVVAVENNNRILKRARYLLPFANGPPAFLLGA